ncbi:MAG: hypothetical protein ABH871_07400 [Pseudomonadota bacterium]
MADEILQPAEPAQSIPFSDKWGLGASCGLRIPISTSISEGGFGGVCSVGFRIADTLNDIYVLQAELPFGTTTLKLFPTTDSEGTTAQHSHFAIKAGFGRMSRGPVYFGDEGDYRVGLITGSIPMIGWGSSTISQPDRTLEGETYSFEDTSSNTVDIGTNYLLMGEFRPWGRGPSFMLGPQFRYGLQYDDEGSDFNRIKLEMGIMLDIGYGDASFQSGKETDVEIGALGITQGLYAMGHSFLQRAMFDKTITQPMEALDEYGLLGNEGATDRGSMADVPFLSGASALMGGADSSATTQLKAGKAWFWIFECARAGGNALLLATGSTQAQAGGFAGLSNATKLIAYPIAGIEAPDKRLSLEPNDVEQREMIIDLVAYGVNTAAMLIGAAAASDMVMLGAGQANNTVAMSPDPLDRNMVERTDYGYIPYSFYSGSEGSGNRAGIVIHNSWHDFPLENFQLYSSVDFLSPMMTFGNIGTTASQDEPYTDVMLPTDVGAGLGLEWKTTWTRLYFGAKTIGIFGGNDDAKVAMGGQAGFDLVLPFNGEEDGSGIVVGASGTAAVELPSGSKKLEFAPWTGASLHF